MNWFILIPVGIALIVLLIFMIVRNQKDEKKFEQQMNNDYEKPKEEKSDVGGEEIMK